MGGGQRPGAYNPANGNWGRAYNPMDGARGPGAYNAAGSPAQTWVLSITVESASGGVEQWSKTLSYASSLASAEWVTEGPSASCNGSIGELPLADYHSVGFSHLEENGATPSIGMSNLVLGYDPYGELSLPAPSFLLKGKTATYFVPFVAKGTALAQGKATCNPMGQKGPYNPIEGSLGRD